MKHHANLWVTAHDVREKKNKIQYNSYKEQVGYIADNIIDGDFSSSYFGEKLITEVEFTLNQLKQSLSNLKGIRPVVHNDQGIQYQSHQWVQTLKQYDAVQSMSHKGTCLYNAQMESFFYIMKTEMMNKHYRTKTSLIKEIMN